MHKSSEVLASLWQPSHNNSEFKLGKNLPWHKILNRVNLFSRFCQFSLLAIDTKEFHLPPSDFAVQIALRPKPCAFRQFEIRNSKSKGALYL
jgi:hypothetical protein